MFSTFVISLYEITICAGLCTHYLCWFVYWPNIPALGSDNGVAQVMGAKRVEYTMNGIMDYLRYKRKIKLIPITIGFVIFITGLILTLSVCLQLLVTLT